MQGEELHLGTITDFVCLSKEFFSSDIVLFGYNDVPCIKISCESAYVFLVLHHLLPRVISCTCLPHARYLIFLEKKTLFYSFWILS